MMPSIIYETLANDDRLAGLLGTTAPIAENTFIYELESCDERPAVADGKYFIIIAMKETTMGNRHRFGPQIMEIWVHTPMASGPDYGQINRILNRVDQLIMPLELIRGTDDVRLTLIEQHGRSTNTIDPGWGTATRNALYGVLYDEASA
jgi:hypothetical protein